MPANNTWSILVKIALAAVIAVAAFAAGMWWQNNAKPAASGFERPTIGRPEEIGEPSSVNGVIEALGDSSITVEGQTYQLADDVQVVRRETKSAAIREQEQAAYEADRTVPRPTPFSLVELSFAELSVGERVSLRMKGGEESDANNVAIITVSNIPNMPMLEASQ